MSVTRSKAASFLNNAQDLYSRLNVVARGVLCIPSVLSSFLTNGGVGSTPSKVLDMAKQIATNTLTNEVAQIQNTVSGAARQLDASITSIFKTFGDVFRTFQSLSNSTAETKDYITQLENCSYYASQLLSCITMNATNIQSQLKELAGDKFDAVDKLTSSITSKAGIVDNFASSRMQSIDKSKMFIALQQI